MMDILLLSKSAIVVLIAYVATAALRRRSSAERHAVWVAAFLALILLAAMSLLPESAAKIPYAITISATTAVTFSASPAIRDWLTIVWIAGATLCLLRLMLGAIHATAIIRSSHKAHSTGAYETRYASRLAGPVAWGIGRKLMLLPASAAAWEEERRAIVLKHEASHLRRKDCWALLIAEIACALYWCNPLVWIAASQLRREQEHAADDEVVIGGADPITYAGHLVRSRNRSERQSWPRAQSASRTSAPECKPSSTQGDPAVCQAVE